MIEIIDRDTHQFTKLPGLHKSTNGPKKARARLCEAAREWTQRFEELMDIKGMTRRKARIKIQKEALEI